MDVNVYGGPKGYLSQIISWVSKESYFFRWRYVLPFVIALWLYFIVGHSLKGVMLVGTLGLIASYSTVYRRVLRIPGSIELVTLGTVLTAVAYGPIAGALFGIITTITSEIISSEVNAFTPLYTFGRGVIGVAAFYLASLNIVTLGIAMVLLFNIITQSLRWLLGDVEQVIEGVYFFTTNSIFNILAFFVLGNFLLSVMT